MQSKTSPNQATTSQVTNVLSEKRRTKILLVDDEKVVRRLYGEELEDTQEGWEVITVPDGFKLLELIEYERPDVVILDIKLEHHDGLDLLQEIRKHFRELPVILCSAYSSYRGSLKSIAADYYVVKSADLNELITKVKMCLRAGTSSHPQTLSKEMAIYRIYRRAGELLSEYDIDSRTVDSKEVYEKLTSDSLILDYATRCSQDEMDSALRAASSDFSRDLRRAKEMIRTALESGYVSRKKRGKIKSLFRQADPPLIISLPRFEMEYHNASQRFVHECERLCHTLKDIVRRIESGDIESVPFSYLKAAITHRPLFDRSYTGITGVIMTEIRHDLRGTLGRLSILLNRLHQQQREKLLAETTTLIRTIQQKEGSSPCYGSEQVEQCAEECLWKAYCRTEYGSENVSSSVEKVSEVYRQLMGINERLYEISSLTVVPDFSPVSAKSLLLTLIENMGLSEPEERKIRLECDDDLEILTDPFLLPTAIRQAVRNSLDALNVEAGGYVKITVQHDAEGVTFLIKDNAHGMPEIAVENAFEPKFRHKKIGQSGMGLTLARLAVDAIGGSIDLESELGKGTTVRIVIPREM